MDPIAAANAVLAVIEVLAKLEPVFVSTWTNLKPFAAALMAQFKGVAPTADELTALEVQVDALAARLQVPLPAAQPGDPDYTKPVV